MKEHEDWTEILKSDPRFSIETYRFVHDALGYADILGMVEGEDDEATPDGCAPLDEGHVTGQELCYAAAEYAVREYGMMAKQVLTRLGLRKTGDFGDVVYNMINFGIICQSDNDSREDFDNVFELGAELDRLFQFQYKADAKSLS